MRMLFSVFLLAMVLVSPVQASLDEYSSPHTIYYSEDWESGIGSWYSTNGVWEVGTPVGGTAAHQGIACLASNLDGNYPDNTDYRFISPSIDLPSDPQDGALWLRFWHWFSLQDYDQGYVQISVDGGDFVTVSKAFASYGGLWSPYILDLSSYSGQSIRLGFFFNEAGSLESWGWYVDQIEILDGNFEWLNPEGFERNIQGNIQYDGWYVENGVWEIGIPTTGPSAPNSGNYCAATRLRHDYPDNVNSRLVSPLVTLAADPLGGELWLSFMHWFNQQDSDYGRVDILTATGWETISGSFSGYSQGWTENIIDLVPYLGQTVRFGFYHIEGGSLESSGWFLDDIAIVEGPKVFNSFSDFEGGTRGWYASKGIWDVGVPTSGPGSAYSGTHCWATNLTGNYSDNNSSTLRTPEIQLPTTPTGDLLLKFQHWFNYSDYEYGQVYIYVDGAAGITIGDSFASTSNGWGQYIIDLAPYAGSKVSFGFYHHEGGSLESSGWYIDDVEIIGLEPTNVPSPLLVSTAYDQAPPAVSWVYAPFDPAYTAVYYSRKHDFIPNLGNRIAMLTDDAWAFTDDDQFGWYHYYQIGLIDDLGYEGVPVGVAPPPSAVDNSMPAIQGAAKLKNNYPNPFNPKTSIAFTVNMDSRVVLEVFDIKGRKVKTLVDKRMTKGDYVTPFNAEELPSGIYLARLTAGETVLSTKMTLVK